MSESPRAVEQLKQAACLNCRRSKMKCIRVDGGRGGACKKCLQRGTECIVPEYHIGRHKGAKNKRSGLDKAVHQLEQAIRNSKAGKDQQSQVSPTPDLEELLKRAQGLLTKQPSESGGDFLPSLQLQHDTPSTSDSISGVNEYSRYPSQSGSSQQPERPTETNNLSVNDAENPLQLLAQTSELLLTPQQLISAPAAASSSRTSNHETDDAGSYSRAFLSRFQTRLDNEPELDPIELGLVTLSEAESLFTFFHEQLAHTRWGLDSHIHTISFIRKRSHFLFTSVLAASSLFLPTTGALSKRLSTHCRKLAINVIKRRKSSVEIVLAFMICIPWMSFGEIWTDDETCTHLAMALTIALDLSLNKIVVGVPSNLSHARVPRADCVDARKALDMDGFSDIEVGSPIGRRLLRRRERVWISLFVLERGVCLARGRSYTLPMSPLIENCDNWHHSDIADTWDGNIVSIAVLRRGLSGLIDRIRVACDRSQVTGANSTLTVDTIQRDIENFFDGWFATWPAQISGQRQLPPYVEILASHTRLSLYSSVINHPSAPVGVKHFFRAAGLSAALNVMRAAVQGESRLKSMPNNTSIMISFAACFALRLSTMGEQGNFPLAPSVQALIEETAEVLERIGSSPPHRKGASALFAKQLRRLIYVKPTSTNHTSSMDPMREPTTYNTTSAQPTQSSHIGDPPSIYPTQPIAFSGMSNNQIIETVNNAGIGFDDSWADFYFDDNAGVMDWLDWPTTIT